MPLSGWLAVIDGMAALALLWSVPRQLENKASVLIVAAVLLGVCGWLSVLALDDGPPRRDEPVQLPPAGRSA
jgi:hypothetical protein